MNKKQINQIYKVRTRIKELILKKGITARDVALKFQDVPGTFISRLNGYSAMSPKFEKGVIKYLRGLK